MKTNLGANVALVAVFAALIAAFSLVPTFMIGTVPFAIQLIIVLLAPLVVGPWQGLLANLLYVVAGVAGLPVFSGQKSGIAVLVGPTGGYLVGYMLAAIAAGFVASLVLNKRTGGLAAILGLTGAALLGVVVIHACGAVGMMVNLSLASDKAVLATLPFVPTDAVKAVLAAIIALAIIKAFPRLLKMRF